MELGLKYSWCKKGSIASRTSGAIIVVALLSRQTTIVTKCNRQAAKIQETGKTRAGLTLL
jgi:hypothetical protein